MTVATLALALVHLAGPRGQALASDIHAEATRAHLDPALMAAVAFRESGLRQSARGAHGEVGLMQIHPRGLATLLCQGLAVRTVRGNLACGARILAHVRARCGGSPDRWLSAYSGRACGPSSYSARILATFRKVAG